ncbi:MAG: DUF882 domain-containing protein [Neomegalonema sp.]|nr:DUF882 domain-containing protein [Neomegalonema sp.]
MWKNNRRFQQSAATEVAEKAITRREVLEYAAIGAGAAATAGLAVPRAKAAPHYLRGLGDYRQLNLVNHRTAEKLNVVYYVDGEYIPEAIDEVSFLMRDWRRNEVMPIDTRTLDLVAAMSKKLDVSEPFQVVSGYRSPSTNDMLRSKGRGVAKNSFHTRGMAVDVALQSRSVGKIYSAAMSCRVGGVGRYTRNHFVHVDCGPPRTWGK